MAVSKYIIRTRKNRIFEYYLDSVDKVLDTYIKEVLGFNKRFKISEEPWINVTNAIKRTSFKVALINGLCRTPDDNIVNILIEQFAYPCEVPNNGFVYEVSNDLTYFTVKKYTGTNTTVQIPDNCGGLPVTKLATEAFNDCEHITELLIPKSLIELDSTAFVTCPSLTTIYFEGTHGQWDELLTGDISPSIHIYYNHKQAHIMSAWVYNEDGTHTKYCLNEYPEGVTSCIYSESEDCSYGDWVIKLPATCNQEGQKIRVCGVCGGQDEEVISKLAHIEGEIKIENEKAPTCEEDGSHDSVIYCAACGEELSREEVVTDTALGHTPSASVIENKIEADCKNNGSYDDVVYCSVCRKELSREEKIIPATGDHVYATEIERKDATCTEAGYKIMACSCGESEKIEISALGHTAGEPVVENEITATCEENGTYDEVTYCSICEEELSRKTVITTTDCVPGLTRQIYVEEPTCSTTGSYYVEVECAYCTNILSTSELFEAPTNPTVHVDNNNDDICDLCGEILLDVEETGTCGDQLTYTLYSDGTLRIQGEGDMYNYKASGDTISPFRDYTIARVSVDTGVSSIGNNAFYECSSLAEITFPSSIASIGYNAFYCCTNLASIDLSNTNLTNIGEYTFYGCTNLSSVDFPEGLEEVGRSSFQNCLNLISVDFPEGVTYIARNAFTGCSNLVSINIPNTCTGIGMAAFVNCTSLVSIELPGSLQNSRMGTGIFSSCTNLSSVVIKNGLTAINEYTFSGCTSLTSIEIPVSVTKIHGGAFNECASLTSMDLSGLAITSIGESAFKKCSNLNMIKLPSSLTSIGMSIFESCTSLTSIDLSNTKLTDTGGYTFRYCSNLTSISLPESLTNIGIYAFYNCTKLASIDFPKSLTAIGNYAFNYCVSLDSIDLSKTAVTSIGSYAFGSCSEITLVSLSRYLTSMGDHAFAYCNNLLDITILDGLTSISDYVFVSCTKLNRVQLPSTITSIGANAFYGCSKLASVDYGGTEEQWNELISSMGTNNTPLTIATVNYQYNK